MNKRARIRLIGVTAVILIAVAAMVYYTGGKQGAYEGDLAAVAEDSLARRRAGQGRRHRRRRLVGQEVQPHDAS